MFCKFSIQQRTSFIEAKLSEKSLWHAVMRQGGWAPRKMGPGGGNTWESSGLEKQAAANSTSQSWKQGGSGGCLGEETGFLAERHTKRQAQTSRITSRPLSSKMMESPCLVSMGLKTKLYAAKCSSGRTAEGAGLRFCPALQPARWVSWVGATTPLGQPCAHPCNSTSWLGECEGSLFFAVHEKTKQMGNHTRKEKKSKVRKGEEVSNLNPLLKSRIKGTVMILHQASPPFLTCLLLYNTPGFFTQTICMYSFVTCKWQYSA